MKDFLEYIPIIITGILGLIGILFKTTDDSIKSQRNFKSLTKVGWLVLLLLTFSLFTTVIVKWRNNEINIKDKKIKQMRDDSTTNVEINHRKQDSIISTKDLNLSEAIKGKTETIAFLANENKELAQQSLIISENELKIEKENREYQKFLELFSYEKPFEQSIIFTFTDDPNENYSSRLVKENKNENGFSGYICEYERELLFPGIGSNEADTGTMVGTITILLQSSMSNDSWNNLFGIRKTGRVTNTGTFYIYPYKLDVTNHKISREGKELILFSHYSDSLNAGKLFDEFTKYRITLELDYFKINIGSSERKKIIDHWNKTIENVYLEMTLVSCQLDIVVYNVYLCRQKNDDKIHCKINSRRAHRTNENN